MKIHVVQKDIANTEFIPFINRAVQQGADLICFGELSTSGCMYQPREFEPFESVLKKLEPYSIPIMLGLPRQTDNGLRNVYMYYHRGEYQLYNKINLFEPMNETSVYTPGNEVSVWETDLGRFGAAICYDIRFPEIFDKLRQSGVKKVFIPAAFPRVRIDQWRDLVIERARQTSAHVVAINAVGDDGTYEFGGTSMVVTPDGSVVAEADQTSETVLEVDL